jgi:hypothetical protein
VGAEQAIAHIARCVQSLEVAAVGRSTIERALQLACSDFEDGIQLAAAEESKVDAIVTRNAIDFSKSTIAVLTPAELLGRIASGTP